MKDKANAATGSLRANIQSPQQIIPAGNVAKAARVCGKKHRVERRSEAAPGPRHTA
jgi:hypothetical protein